MLGDLGSTSEYDPTEEIEIEPEIDEQFNRIIIKGEVEELKKFISALAYEKNQEVDWQSEEIIEKMELFEQDEITELSDHEADMIEFGNHILEIGKAEDFGGETSNPESLALVYFYKDSVNDSKEEKEKHFEEIKETFGKIMKDREVNY